MSPQRTTCHAAAPMDFSSIGRAQVARTIGPLTPGEISLLFVIQFVERGLRYRAPRDILVRGGRAVEPAPREHGALSAYRDTSKAPILTEVAPVQACDQEGLFAVRSRLDGFIRPPGVRPRRTPRIRIAGLSSLRTATNPSSSAALSRTPSLPWMIRTEFPARPRLSAAPDVRTTSARSGAVDSDDGRACCSRGNGRRAGRCERRRR